MLILCALLAAACNRAPKNNEAIRQAVVEHLQKNTGLDLNAMTVEVTSVQYRDKEADAVVSFQPKNAPGGGMSMNYTLETQGGKWVVRKRAGSEMGHGGPEGGPAGGQMPPGHPPAGAGQQAGSSSVVREGYHLE